MVNKTRQWCLTSPPLPLLPPRSKLGPTAWQSGASSSMWAASCRLTGGRTRSSRGCAQEGRSSDPSAQLYLFSSRSMVLGSMLKVYESLVLPRLMYGAVWSWALTEAQGA